MNEVEMMYRNAHVYPRVCGDITKETFENKVFNTADMCNKAFTAEKQIDLIKWISNNDRDKNKELTLYNSTHPYYYFGLHHEPAHSEDDMWGYGEGLGTTFEDGLAKLINSLWQDLTEADKAQIKEIL